MGMPSSNTGKLNGGTFYKNTFWVEQERDAQPRGKRLPQKNNPGRRHRAPQLQWHHTLRTQEEGRHLNSGPVRCQRGSSVCAGSAPRPAQPAVRDMAAAPGRHRARGGRAAARWRRAERGPERGPAREPRGPFPASRGSPAAPGSSWAAPRLGT